MNLRLPSAWGAHFLLPARRFRVVFSRRATSPVSRWVRLIDSACILVAIASDEEYQEEDERDICHKLLSWLWRIAGHRCEVLRPVWRPALRRGSCRVLIRFAAVLVDAVILTIVNLVLSAIVGSTAIFLGLAVGIAYTIGFWTASGATPGKMMFGLKVLTVDGDPIGLDKAVLRYIGLWVNTLTLGIGYLFIAFRKDKRGLHDLIAGTRVIRTGQ